MEVVVATRNQHKFREIKALLKGLEIRVLSLNDFKKVPKVIEDGRTLEDNARKKAIENSRFLKKLVIADDSGLEIHSLGNKPGVYSARFSGKGATYKGNNEKVLRLLKDKPFSQRKARFRCIIALADNGKLVGVVEGNVKGSITSRPFGKAGFGYDPIFIPCGYKKTFAQIGLKEKNKISHRSRALVRAKRLIEKYLL